MFFDWPLAQQVWLLLQTLFDNSLPKRLLAALIISSQCYNVRLMSDLTRAQRTSLRFGSLYTMAFP